MREQASEAGNPEIETVLIYRVHYNAVMRAGLT